MMVMYRFKVKNGFKVKKNANYPWPCASEKDRMLFLHVDDVLTKGADGKYTKHTGICKFGIILTDDEVEPIGKTIKLVMH